MHRQLIFAVVAWFLVNVSAQSQERDARPILTAMELAYPSSEVPALFSVGSASSVFSEEPEDRMWSADMEAQILLLFAQAQEQGLVVRRTDVECRSSSCALLLVHAVPTAAVRDLTASLRETLDFAEVSTSEKMIPMMQGSAVNFMLGYSEIVLLGK